MSVLGRLFVSRPGGHGHGRPARDTRRGTGQRLDRRRLRVADQKPRQTTRVKLIGAIGTIGSAVCAALPARGDERVAPSRDPERARAVLDDQIEVHARTEPPERRAPAAALAGADAVVHLSGEAVAPRDSEQAMARIPGSRVQGGRLLAAALRGLTGDSSSRLAIDFYRPQRQRDVLGDR